MTRREPQPDSSLERLVTALVPLLSRSLSERFDVFRVMHHGTHEKQISNVFAWLLRIGGTHGFRDAFQRIFVEQVNRALPEESQLPTTGYRVDQEVDTSGHDALGKDIADVVRDDLSERHLCRKWLPACHPGSHSNQHNLWRN